MSKNQLVLKKDPKGGENNLSVDEIFRFMDLYFDRYGIMYSHLYNSMNKFFDEDIRQFLENGDHTFYERVTKNQVIKYKFKYENISVKEPTLDNDVEPMFPSDARNRNLTYSSKLIAKVTQIQETIDIATDEKTEKVIGQPEENVPVAILPVMMRSKYCSLNIYKGYDKSECEYDPGGYFIVNGSEKVIICQDRMIENKPLVFLRKESGNEYYNVQVNSKSYKPHGLQQIISMRIKKDGNTTIRVPILNEVNVFILFRALGIESDKDIINYVTYNEKDSDMIDLVRLSLEYCKNEKGQKIQTQQDAIDYLVTKLRVLKKYSENDKTTKSSQRRIHLMSLLEYNFIPHIEGSLQYKAYYLGYMINKLLNVVLGRTKSDDRDSYINKRVDLPGDLLMELFKQFYRKMLNECNKFIKKKRSVTDDEAINIINQIKPNIIEQGIKASLSTGAWPRRKGVAQMLQRLTYVQTISFLRRVDTPGGDASTSKLTGPRHLHPSSVSLLCCLTGDTNVLMSDGTQKQIKDITENDEIITVDYQRNNIIRPSKIQKYFVKKNQPIIKLTFDNGNYIKCTLDHPILTYNFDKFAMKNAGDIILNDTVQTYHNNSLDVTKVINIEFMDNEDVYDFETIEDSHTIIANGIVTSNCVQTPEHAKVGLTKHLALIASISILQSSQLSLIKNYLKRKVINLRDVSPSKINSLTKVFLNGEWLGVTTDSFKLEEDMRTRKLDGTFDPVTSIVHDIINREIRVYCEGGRMYRPVIRVEDNKIKLTKDLINEISLNKSEKDKKITQWEEFMLKHPGVIEYIDMEEQPYLLVADKISKVEDMRKRMIESVDKAKEITHSETEQINNRYDDLMYQKYTHSEFHPSFLLGEIATNIPFCNHNAGPRNIFFYAQAKQAMGVYISNYRDRLDISYILYHPQKPLINTRTSKYNYTDVLSAGENAVVAIACYTGYNQEDSLVFNLSAIDRGLFRSTSLKKHITIIQKNQSTSQDDMFIKPDPSKVVGMRNGSYDKLNEKGFVPEETTIVNGDIILGKVSPIQPVGNSTKVFKDSSEVYKSHASAVIDKVYTNIFNNEGYEMRKMRTRSERTPMLGDKFSSRHGQKGTVGITLRQSDMPFTKNGISPDIIVNPNAIPSRILLTCSTVMYC